MDAPTKITIHPKHLGAMPPSVQEALRGPIKQALLADPLVGDRIRRELWPKRFRALPNLFRLELPGAHRGLYSILTYPGQTREIRIVWLGNHQQYDRLFGYATS